jgi:hypothetical protein
MSIFDENGHPTEDLFDRLEAGEKLEGYAALAVLAGGFSNATHGNYSAEQMVERTSLTSQYRITVEKYNSATADDAYYGH